MYIDFDELIYLKLNPKQQELFENGNLNADYARVLLDIPNETVREELLIKITDENLTPRQAKEEYFRMLKDEKFKGNKLPSKIYVNTIDNVVDRILEKGVEVNYTKSETPMFYECMIKIPK